MSEPSSLPEPTDGDRCNAATRQAIAERQAREYRQVLAWALSKFGRGWEPSARHFLLDHDEEDRCRRTGERPKPAATCYTVKNCVGRKRYFTVSSEGIVTEHTDYKEAFGGMLLELHPTQRIEVRGQLVAPHRYSLCWAPIELYEPKSAEELAALRASREKGKAVRELRKFAQENPLLAQAGIKPEDVRKREDQARGR